MSARRNGPTQGRPLHLSKTAMNSNINIEKAVAKFMFLLNNRYVLVVNKREEPLEKVLKTPRGACFT